MALSITYDSHSQIFSNPFSKKEESSLPKLTSEDIQSLRKDLVQLTSVNMNGRVAGTTNEQVAANFISARMKEIGLKEVDKNFQRKFSFSTGKTISTESELIIDKTAYKVPSDARPLYFGAMEMYDNFYITGMNEYENVWVLPIFDHQNQLKLSLEEKEAMMHKKARNAYDRGARTVIFYNNMTSDFVLEFNHKGQGLPQLMIPVFEISQSLYTSKISLLRKMSYIKVEPKISENLKQGINVYGMINNGSDKTVIISANYDGYIPSVDKITSGNYPGANNNASGVATMLLLASKLKNIKSNYNYLFIAYSGTNFSLSGSNKFLNDNNFFKDKVAFAIHLDKVGRYDITSTVTVNGVGTYAAWRGFFKDNELDNQFVLINKGEDRTSDFNTYYDSKIPYLSFTTGFDHENGTSEDSYNKINYFGIGYITHKAMQIVTQLDASRQTVTFTPTQDKYDKAGEIKNVQPGVSLGITPDLQFKTGGLRIHKVTKGQDADIAGLKEGDIIVLLRNYPVQNYDDYILALSKFKKGDKIYIRVKRGNSVLQKLVTFS